MLVLRQLYIHRQHLNILIVLCLKVSKMSNLSNKNLKTNLQLIYSINHSILSSSLASKQELIESDFSTKTKSLNTSNKNQWQYEISINIFIMLENLLTINVPEIMNNIKNINYLRKIQQEEVWFFGITLYGRWWHTKKQSHNLLKLN